MLKLETQTLEAYTRPPFDGPESVRVLATVEIRSDQSWFTVRTPDGRPLGTIRRPSRLAQQTMWSAYDTNGRPCGLSNAIGPMAALRRVARYTLGKGGHIAFLRVRDAAEAEAE